jgi:hypothetical protein
VLATGRTPGAILSVTGGQADLDSYPLPRIGDFGARHGELRLAGGGGCLRAAREQLRRKAWAAVGDDSDADEGKDADA